MRLTQSSSNRKRVRSLLFLIYFSCSLGCLFGQNAAIQGLVSDASSAAVPQVQVTVANQATGISVNVSTNDSGIYSAPLLPTGTYRITASKAGFANAIREIKLDVGQTARIDFTLSVGEVASVVNVDASAPLLQSETTTMG